MNKSGILFFLFVFSISCTNDKPGTNSNRKEFECKEIGWTFDYPSDWKVLSSAEIDTIEGRGKSAVESMVGEEIQRNNQNLLYLKKNPLNSFTSTLQPYDSAIDGSYQENQSMLTRLIVETYQKQGIQFDFKTGRTEVDGLEFSTLESTIYSSDRKRVIMYQVMFDRLFDGKNSLTFSINYNNDKDRKALLSILESSTFTSRN